MEFPLAPHDQDTILRQYERNLSRYPVIKAEADRFLEGRDEDFSLCMKYLWGHLSAQDALSVPPSVLAGYANASLQALAQFDYLRTVPPEIFFPYVLYHRVNSEYADNSRGDLLEALLPLVRGKTMEQAALTVNYWCYAHATYTPADDRTLGPLAVLHRTLGRCGEESVLTVAALRSVGIPARQVYCPRWSHCDDNHAWVEVWIDGDWHYLGACEPEPVLNRGWFTAAASRAMRIDTKQWSGEGLYDTVNCTSRYTDSRMLTVQATENGIPTAGARVCFQIVNYSELYTLWETTADENGFAHFETGPGDLFVYARHDRKVALQQVDLRQRDTIVLELEQDFPGYLTADLVPPEDSSGNVPHTEDTDHQERLQLCETHLSDRRAAFAEAEGYLCHAGLNAPEIRAFLEDPRYPQSCKEELLNTLRPKDFVDISCETLMDALDTAAPATGQYSGNIYRKYVLAPRIADEMLLPERRAIRSLFPQGFSDPGEILAWMRSHLQILPDQGVSNYYPSALGCLRCRQVPSFAFDMVFVALCRAFRFPAKLEIHNGEARWMDDHGNWHSIRREHPPVCLTLEIPTGKRLNYFEHITLGRWDGADFVTLKYPDLVIENRHTLSLQPGFYRITVTTRQIDGTASVAIWHLDLCEDRTLSITPPADQTPQRLKQIPLHLPAGPLQTLLQKTPDKNRILIFSDPGSEPTEHLLREMLECADQFRCLPCRILLLTETPESLTHPTMRLLQAALPDAEILHLRDPDTLAALHLQMQVGDLRLPFVVCIDAHGQGIHAEANYRIRMAQTLLEIQKLLPCQDPFL